MLEKICQIAQEAGRLILNHYDGDMQVEHKADESPLTIADRASHEHIARELALHFPHIPVISEESEPPEFFTRAKFKEFWIVDPLDGTKEFIKKNGEFTVNIALIRDKRPVLGVVDVPIRKHTYMAEKGKGAFFQSDGGALSPIRSNGESDRPLKIAVSRSHPSPQLLNLFESLDSPEQIPLGSSLKFCLLAAGEIDLYPRFGPTMEWDTAAAQAVVEESGGVMLGMNGSPFMYNKPVLLNEGFLVARSAQLAKQVLGIINQG